MARPERFELPTFWFVGGNRATQQTTRAYSNQRNQQETQFPFGWYRTVLYPVHGNFTETFGRGKWQQKKSPRRAAASGPSSPTNRRIFAYFHIEKHRPSDLSGDSVRKRLVPGTHKTASARNSLTGSRLVNLTQFATVFKLAVVTGVPLASFFPKNQADRDADFVSEIVAATLRIARIVASASACKPDVPMQRAGFTRVAASFRNSFRVLRSRENAA